LEEFLWARLIAYNYETDYSEYYPRTHQEVAEHLLETDFPGFQPISEPQSQFQPITSKTEDWQIASSVITEEKIR
jgi:hypothetical protein